MSGRRRDRGAGKEEFERAEETWLRAVGRRAADDTDRVRIAVKEPSAKFGEDVADPTYIFNAHGVGCRFAAAGGLLPR